MTRPRSKIASTMQWYFDYSPTFTKVLTLRVLHVVPGTRVLVTCAGSGCPFAHHTIKVAKPKPKACPKGSKTKCSSPTSVTVDLGGSFRDHNLVPGLRISVQLTRPGW